MFGLNDVEWRGLRASLKTSTRDRPLAPGAVAVLLNKALRQTNLSELAAALEFKDQSTLRKIANLAHLPPDLLADVTWGARKGAVSMTVAVELQRCNDAKAMRARFEIARSSGMSRTQARRFVRSNSPGQEDELR